jgi:hypothetical protein
MNVSCTVASSDAARGRTDKRLAVLTEQCAQLEAARDHEVSSVKSITDDAISSMQVS